MTGWEPDVLPGYWQCTIPLGPDPAGEGDIAATLIRRGREACASHAVLAVHGYTDYFFHTALADHFAGRGFDFYALDLQKCGRSRRDGQTPHFITDLARYDTELERALAIIGEQARPSHPVKVLVYGHSAGGLIVSLWLDRLRRQRPGAHAGVGGLVLNSPFLDLHGPAVSAPAGDLGDDRRPVAGALQGRAPARQQGRLRHHPAPRLSTASSTTTCSGNRWAASRSPSAGCTPCAAASAGCIAGSTSVCPI